MSITNSNIFSFLSVACKEIDRKTVQGRSLNNTEQLKDVPMRHVLHTMNGNIAKVALYLAISFKVTEYKMFLSILIMYYFCIHVFPLITRLDWRRMSNKYKQVFQRLRLLASCHHFSSKISM